MPCLPLALGGTCLEALDEDARRACVAQVEHEVMFLIIQELLATLPQEEIAKQSHGATRGARVSDARMRSRVGEAGP